MKKVNRFFWWCAGANLDILEECPTDHAKYFGVGGTIIFTALMASFAGGYAFFTAFKSVLPSLFFGAFWGLLIFNLDRYIVATIGKGDGTSKITKEEWKIARPRLLMAILLGIVIATPLELKIFEKEIETVVERLKIEKAEELKAQDTTSVAELNSLKERRAFLENEIKELLYDKTTLSENAGKFFESNISEQKNELKNKESYLKVIQEKVNKSYGLYVKAEQDSLSKSIVEKRLRNYKANQSRRNKARKEVKEIQDRIQELQDEKGSAIIEEMNRINELLVGRQEEMKIISESINSKQSTIDYKNRGYENKTENYNGFAAHLEAMNILTKISRNENGEINIPAMFWAKWLITLLFIFIEVAPVLFKLMAEAGPYDDMMDRIKHESNIREKQKISNLDDEINTSLQISTEKNLNRLNAELANNKALMDKIAQAQAEVAELAVLKWKEDEINKIQNGVNHIINTKEITDTDNTKEITNTEENQS